MSERTVLEVLLSVNACHLLGVDPDMPFEQFARWLRWGQLVETITELRPETWWTRKGAHYAEGWDDCLRRIKADR